MISADITHLRATTGESEKVWYRVWLPGVNDRRRRLFLDKSRSRTRRWGRSRHEAMVHAVELVLPYNKAVTRQSGVC
jgi:hypothetical protein